MADGKIRLLIVEIVSGRINFRRKLQVAESDDPFPAFSQELASRFKLDPPLIRQRLVASVDLPSASSNVFLRR